MNVLFKTDRIISRFTSTGKLGNLLANRKSDIDEIKPRQETSIVKVTIVLPAVSVVPALKRPMYFWVLYCLEANKFVSWHIVNSKVLTDVLFNIAMSGRKFTNRSLVGYKSLFGISTKNVWSLDNLDLIQVDRSLSTSLCRFM